MSNLDDKIKESLRQIEDDSKPLTDHLREIRESDNARLLPELEDIDEQNSEIIDDLEEIQKRDKLKTAPFISPTNQSSCPYSGLFDPQTGFTKIGRIVAG